jgi:hypothetical protein
MSAVSVQAARVGIDGIEEGVVRLSDGQHRAVLAVEALNFALLGEAEQEALVAGFAGFLNGLGHPLQLLVRVLPVDVDRYLADLEARARRERSEALAELARDHLAFVRRLAHSRTLLERRFYVVVPSEDAALHRRGWTLLRRLLGRRSDPALGEAAAVRRELTRRCDEVAGQLARCGLVARRLDDADLARLFHACWCPELARVQRIRRALADYTAPVVRGAPAPDGGAPCRS